VFQIKDKAKFKGTLQEYIASIKSNEANYVDDPVSISNTINILNVLFLLLLLLVLSLFSIIIIIITINIIIKA